MSKSLLLAKIGSYYGVKSETEGDNLIKYHQHLRSTLNTELSAAVTAQNFERKKDVWSRIADTISDGLGMVPFFGNMAQNAIKLGIAATTGFAEANKARQYDNVRNFLPNSDSQESAQFSKDLATEILNRKSDKIKSLKSFDEVKKLAEKDAQTVLKLIKEGEAVKLPEYQKIIDTKNASDILQDPENSNLALKNLANIVADSVSARNPERNIVSDAQEKRVVENAGKAYSTEKSEADKNISNDNQQKGSKVTTERHWQSIIGQRKGSQKGTSFVDMLSLGKEKICAR